VEALYVSPCFVTVADLRRNFARGLGTGVIDASLLAPLSSLSTIHDHYHHSFSYPEDGSAFRVHSTPSQPHRALDSPRAALDRLERDSWDRGYFSNLRDVMHQRLAMHDLPPEPPEGTEFAGPLADIAATLDQRLGAVMALFPDDAC
jgi:hypothetical protein